MNDVVLIAEHSPSGHRLVYVRLLVQGVSRRGLRPVLVLSSEVLASDEYARHLLPMREAFDVIVADARMSVSALQCLAIRRRASRLVIPDSNWRVLQLALGRSNKSAPVTVALMMRDPRWELVGSHLPSPRTLLKVILFWVASRRRVAEVVWLREPGHSSPGRHANDPVLLDGTYDEIVAAARGYRRVHGMDDDVFWFGIAGVISDAKQIPTVARAAAAAARRTGRRVGLALLGPWKAAGTVKRELFEVVDESNLPLVLNSALHTNFEMNVAVRALDCVVAAYDGAYGPSSTLGKAAALGVRAIGAGPKSQRIFVESITGLPGVRVDHDEITQAMVSRLSSESPRPRRDLGPEQFWSALLD